MSVHLQKKFRSHFQDPKVAESAEHHDNPQKEIDATIDGNRSEAKPDESTKATEKPPSDEDDGKENQVEDETDGGEDKLLDI